jgi:putative transposase
MVPLLLRNAYGSPVSGRNCLAVNSGDNCVIVRNYRFSGFRKAGYMARLPLMVLSGIPHHVTQGGYRRERTFFEDADYALYLDLLAEAADRHGVESWS